VSIKLYDRRCSLCGAVDRDIIAKRAKDLTVKCDTKRCKGKKEWMPSYGSHGLRSPWYDIATDRAYSSYGDLDKNAKKLNQAIVSKAEFERRRIATTEERLEKTGIRKEVREEINRISYRVKHGYMKKGHDGNYHEA
jgi:hypothetical protein